MYRGNQYDCNMVSEISTCTCINTYIVHYIHVCVHVHCVLHERKGPRYCADLALNYA